MSDLQFEIVDETSGLSKEQKKQREKDYEDLFDIIEKNGGSIPFDKLIKEIGNSLPILDDWAHEVQEADEQESYRRFWNKIFLAILIFLVIYKVIFPFILLLIKKE